ncbi:MAG: collagenase, partial [Gemmatimonadota bacterium]|nr:collagenase [Gemmatimonadota bacterium]
MALLVALSTGLAEATVAGESLPISLGSRDTTPLDQEWSSLRPAAKAVAQASECLSVDVAALTGDALTNYLQATSEGCLARTLHISSNPSIRADVPTIFSSRNMQSVLAKIEVLAVGYDGTNSTGMLQLWFFVQTGYSYQRWFSSESGVGSFDAATDRAYLAASDAFASSDHFYAPNNEAAQILYYYFEAAFAAGLRRNHLAPIKKVLSGFTPERAGSRTSAPQPWAFITVLRRVHGAFQNQDEGLTLHQNFMDALAQDPEFVGVMLQVTRYDFFFFLEESDSFTYRLRLLETAIKILVRFTHLDSLKEAAISALTSVLSEHPRLSSPFLTVARALENQVDCASLNICRDVLEREILAQALPKTYSFDDGAIVFQTPLDLEEKEVQLWYYAAKEVQAQFHRLVETDEVVRDDVDVFTARIYDTKLDYTIFEAYLSYADTRGIHSSGFYSDGIMRTFIHNQPGDRTTYGVGSFEEVIRHEYAHYLADRFGLHGGPWFDEGLAEFLVGSTQAEGTPVRPTQVRYIASDELRLDPARLFNSEYSGDLGGGHFYYYADLFFHFMYQQRRTQLLELFDLLRSGDYAAYDAQIGNWAADSQLAADFDAFLDEQVANVSWGIGSTPTSVPQTTSLTSDSPAEIESALQRINSDLGLRCQTVATGSMPRFGCAGTLPAGSEFSGDQGELSSEDQGESSLFDLFDAFDDIQFSEDRGELNEHLNTRLDSFIVAAVEDGAINNFNAMNCYFANIAGSPPVADLYCEGPLRPADVDWVPPQVDLKATLTNLSGGSSAYVEERLRLRATLDFPEEAASNVIVTWTASLPVTGINVGSGGRCEVLERTERKGTLACGTVYNENDGWPLTLRLALTPLQAGSLDFSVEFSADESEVESADNIASMQWTISRESQYIDTLSDHTSRVSSVAFSPDGTTFASGSGDSTVKLWNLVTKANTATLSDHTSWVSSVAFSPDGTLAAGLADGTIKLWNLATKTNTATLRGGSRVFSVAFSPDGTLAAGLEDGSVKLWDVATKTKTNTLSWDTDRVHSVAFSPDGTLAAGLGNSSSKSNHAAVKLWNVATKNIVTLSGHRGHVKSVAFSPDGTTVASGAADGSGVRLWNVATETSTTLDVRWRVQSVAFSPDGATLAVATNDNGTVQLWDVATKTNIATFSGHSDRVNSVAFSPDGTMLASGSNDKTIQLWDVSEWKRAKRLARAEEQIGQPDGP